MSGRQTSVRAFFTSSGGSKSGSQQTEVAATSVATQPTSTVDPIDLDSDENYSGSKDESEVHTLTEGGPESSQDLILHPNQPRLKSFLSKTFGKSKLECRSFNSKWSDKEKCSTWLHWNSGTEKAYCFLCRNVYLLKQLTFSKCAENAFISTGFDTWENATKAFEKHQKSACHQEAVLKWHHHENHTNISAQLHQQLREDQKKNRYCLYMLFTSIEYLARQALPLRGHIEVRSNLYRLMALRENDSDDLKLWLRRTRSYMPHDRVFVFTGLEYWTGLLD